MNDSFIDSLSDEIDSDNSDEIDTDNSDKIDADEIHSDKKDSNELHSDENTVGHVRNSDHIHTTDQDRNSDIPIFSVHEFNEMITMHLGLLGEIVVEGEITSINVSQGKWLFITLKDEYAKVEVFGVAFQLDGWRMLEEGMKVHVYGVPKVHLKSGRFSITAERITPAGEGSLKKAYEKLKQQLEHEGLFDEDRKRMPPKFPEHVALLTAKGSEAYNDFTKILESRMGGVHVRFLPVNVQGEQAVSTICNALHYINDAFPDLDAIVVCRGGGSLEDLHAFNDEAVVRAIFASKIPVICGVGHEGDVSLADMVADVRASTPTHAAEILVEERENTIRYIDLHIKKIQAEIFEKIAYMQNRIQFFYRSTELMQEKVQSFIERIDAVCAKGLQTITSHINRAQQKITYAERMLTVLDHKNVLARGFSITTGPDGAILTHKTSVKKGDTIHTELKDGKIQSNVT